MKNDKMQNESIEKLAQALYELESYVAWKNISDDSKQNWRNRANHLLKKLQSLELDITEQQDAKTAKLFYKRLEAMLAPETTYDYTFEKPIDTGDWILLDEQLELLKKEFDIGDD